MKRLHITFIKAGEVAFDKELNYFINDGKMNFVDQDTAFKILLEDKIFMKKNKESLIKIDFRKKKIEIKLLVENLDIDIDIKKCKFNIDKESMYMEYIIDDGENTLNTISIDY